MLLDSTSFRVSVDPEGFSQRNRAFAEMAARSEVADDALDLSTSLRVMDHSPAAEDDASRLQALQIRARFRGFDLPEDTGRYLLKRTPRGPASLFSVLDTLDRAALVAQKRLTIPFVRSVLDA